MEIEGRWIGVVRSTGHLIITPINLIHELSDSYDLFPFREMNRLSDMCFGSSGSNPRSGRRKPIYVVPAGLAEGDLSLGRWMDPSMFSGPLGPPCFTNRGIIHHSRHKEQRTTVSELINSAIKLRSKDYLECK
jgi:hypothetical protein